MPDSNHVIYPPHKLEPPDPIEQLAELDRYIKNARKQLAHYKLLSTLGILDTRRLFYSNQEIKDGIEYWNKTVENLITCFNSQLDSMKIK